MNAFLLAVLLAAAPDELDRFLGEWRGDSTCVAKNTACHDESVVYRITKGSAGNASVSADKIVNGKPINMGTLDFRQEGDSLICEYAQGVWRMNVDGGKMEGTLTVLDGTIFRRISLHK